MGRLNGAAPLVLCTFSLSMEFVHVFKEEKKEKMVQIANTSLFATPLYSTVHTKAIL